VQAIEKGMFNQANLIVNKMENLNLWPAPRKLYQLK
jgi:hypothetical protein